MEGTRPTWLLEACPAWCTRAHLEDDHPEDRYHESFPTSVPVVAATADTIPATASLTAMNLLVQLHRHIGELVEWIAIEPTESRQPRLILTRESARTLALAMRDLANSADH